MKEVYLRKKMILIAISSLLILQSCTVYQNTSVTLQEASKTNVNALVTKTTDVKTKYSKIIMSEGKFYGIPKNEKKKDSILLTESEIKSIQLKNKTDTTMNKVGLALGTTAAVAVIIGGILFISHGFSFSFL